MIIKIDDRDIEINKIIYNDQSFGRPTSLKESKFEILIPKKNLISLFGDEYDNYVNECKVDDEENGEVDIPLLSEAGYPLLEDTISDNPDLLVYLIKEYMYFNLLDCLFDKKNRGNWTFAINSIKDVIIGDELISMRGSVYPIK